MRQMVFGLRNLFFEALDELLGLFQIEFGNPFDPDLGQPDNVFLGHCPF